MTGVLTRESLGLRWEQLLARPRSSDPEHDALRRAARAGLVLPIVAVVGLGVGATFGSQSQTTMFAIFGAVALLVVVDFPGNRAARALAYTGLGFNGVVLISLGTLVSPHPWLAVPAMFVIGVLVTFSGVLSEIVAAGQRATLMTFVLPVCTPAGPVPDRLLGWAVACAIAIPAALFLFPPTHHDDLRKHAAQVCRLLAARLEGAATAQELSDAMDALNDNFLGADYRPVGLTAGSRALVRVVDDLRWLCDRATDATGALLAETRAPAVRVLGDCARVLSTPQAEGRDSYRADLTAAVTAHRAATQGRYREDIELIRGEPDDAVAVATGRKLLRLRTFSACIGAIGRIIGFAADADARPVWARVLGRRLPPSGMFDRVLSESQAVSAIPSGFVATRAVVVRNSLRTGIGLAVAVAVTHLFPLEHGFWIAMASLSVLRSSALTTGTRVVRAVGGTAIGFLLGTVIIHLIGANPVLLWLLLPVVAFGSAYVPDVFSFVAGQVMFTMLVLTIYNVISPAGWRVGLVRLENVLVGAAVGVVVSLLLWPRGSAAVVHRTLEAARAVGTQYLTAAVRRVTRGASEAATDRVHALSFDALTASRTVDDAVRHFLSESSGATELRAPVVRAANQAVRLRAAADLIADVVPPPLAPYRAARAVLEDHTASICAQILGTEPAEATPRPPISDDFVLALRAEPDAGTLSVEAALPLVTVAASLGELELLSLDKAPS
ncbi:FUSC family protein [Mycobacterium sp. CBMA293]|uniref:FUSC family protein n=1 Tax=unclassified Mycolicibacterium TaxID=2636767 RepID=UPI0012DF37F8|nr:MULTISPECIES: FUSC family protein [unclassified Mycolicibacterium]MUL47529.1 FUSC family protein [Mycolicibacterium sp. CBMA 360]MUL59516.1 FUSC family protein [Mycolicibacterium sp. CBMA 335]MUL71241.1 FUSC family protein [Mycolicibacterium sp. CBMA 311]MUL94884.1 FUSC family protein [Mycolicibacterium sp. CBMA 230]MUM03724.1 FUSC family protein [Mycolicibacterium sp. CBMA 213]